MLFKTETAGVKFLPGSAPRMPVRLIFSKRKRLPKSSLNVLLFHQYTIGRGTRGLKKGGTLHAEVSETTKKEEWRVESE